MAKLWEKGEALDADVHRFTVGDDPIWDQQLLRWDLIGSAAHARMLAKIGILTKDECHIALAALKKMLVEADAGKISIPVELEDCHTTIETLLVEQVGDIGLKIHTGRSRNDQTLLVERLYLRNAVSELLEQLVDCNQSVFKRFNELGAIVMPGYTHLQRAMPSSVGMWLHSWGEGILQLIEEGIALLRVLDRNPLGAASGFSVPLSLDREHTSELLGFSRVQRSPIDVQNSRGRYGLKTLRWTCDIASIVEKFSVDFALFSTTEFDFFKLPVAFTTGSSIMPQKRNPDVIELLRGHTAAVRGSCAELEWLIAKLPSSYHREFQLCKPPMLRGIGEVENMLRVFQSVVERFEVKKERLESAMSEDLYATYEVFREVRGGKSFRTAYQEVAKRSDSERLAKSDLAKDFEIIWKQVQQDAKAAASELQDLSAEVDAQRQLLNSIEEQVFQA